MAASSPDHLCGLGYSPADPRQSAAEGEVCRHAERLLNMVHAYCEIRDSWIGWLRGDAMSRTLYQRIVPEMRTLQRAERRIMDTPSVTLLAVLDYAARAGKAVPAYTPREAIDYPQPPVAGNVDTEAGAALDDTAFVERATAPGTHRIGIDLGGRLFRVNERDGAIQGHSVDIVIEWEAPGLAVERRTLTLTHDRQTLLRRTLAYDLGSARDWTVRVRRTSDPSADERTFDELAWAALRSYQPDEAGYEGQTRLGVRIRASGQLTGRLDRLSAIVRQRVPTWDGVRWTAPLPSSNPAYLFRWYARGVHGGGRAHRAARSRPRDRP